MIWTQVYSKSSAAGRKRLLDLMILGLNKGDPLAIDFTKEDYVRALIGGATSGAVTISNLASGLQFFILRGGAEGFLDASHDNQDASRMVEGGQPTAGGQPGTTMIFDDTNLLAVFDPRGKMISSALLSRPISITHPNIWAESRANEIFDAWDKQPVGLYRNDNPNFEIHYFGLWVDDSKHFYSQNVSRIDMHKQEDTNGCIFIIDANTPPVPDDALPAAARAAAVTKLNQFEPQLIKDVQKAIGATTKNGIGTMRMITIK